MGEYFGPILIENIPKNPADLLPEIQSLIPTLGLDLEHEFHKLIPTLQSLLSFPTLTKQIQKILSGFMTQTKDQETVFSLLLKSLYDANWKARLSSLNIITALFHPPLSGISSHLQTSFLTVLNTLKTDTSSLISSSASRIISDFFPTSKPDPPIPFAYTLETPSEIPKSYQSLASSNGLVFNLVEPGIIAEIEDEGNWRGRVLATQRLESAIDELENLEKLVPYLAIFLRLIAKLIKDKNFKVSETALSISEKLIKCRQLCNVGNFSLIVPSCIEKLGDNKISIRMTSFRVLRGLLLVLRPSVMIPFLSNSLESQNWHVREELVGLLITSLLLNLEYEYSDVIEPLARLLDDPKPKVKNVVIEAFAVLNLKIASLKESLTQILDKEALNKITLRLSNESLVKLTDDYLEYPKPSIISTSSLRDDIREEIFSARVEFPMKTQELSIDSKPRPISQIKVNQSVKTYDFLSRRLSPTEAKRETETFYLSDDQLKPVKNPHDLLQKILNREDWEEQFEAVTILRRLTKYHPEVFFSKVLLHNVVLDVVKWADSLRSSLAKNALILLKDMCEKLRKSMDSEISDLFKILLKKSVDTNTFINEQAKKTMEAMLKALSEQKLVSFLLFHCQNTKNPAIKAQLAWAFNKIFNRAKEGVPKIRDIEKAVQVLAEYLNDASGDVRKQSQEAFDELFKAMKESDFEVLLIRSLKENLYQKVVNYLKKLNRTFSPFKSVSDPKFKTGMSLRRKFPELSLKKSAQDLSEVFRQVSDGDWKARLDSISRIFEASKTTNFNLCQAEQVVTALSVGLNDSNIKVQIHTLVTLKKMIPKLKSLLNPYLLQLLSEICKLINSQNRHIRDSASECLPIFANYCDIEILIISVINSVKTCRSKGRIVLLRFLSGKVKNICEDDLQKFVEVAVENLEYPRQEVRAEAESCIIFLYEFIKEKMFGLVPEGKREIVSRVLEIEIN